MPFLMMNKVALSIDIYSHISVNKNNRMCSFIFLRVDPMIYIYIYTIYQLYQFHFAVQRWHNECMHTLLDIIFIGLTSVYLLFSAHKDKFRITHIFFLSLVNMSTRSRNKMHMRTALLFCFDLKKSAIEAHRMLVKAYGNDAISERSCRDWYHRFKAGNFDLASKKPENRPKKFENLDLQALLDEDDTQTQKQLAERLGVAQQTVSDRLRAMGMVQISGKWVSHGAEKK